MTPHNEPRVIDGTSTMSEMAKKAKMSRHVNLFLAVVLVLVFGPGRTVAANPLENGDDWLKWNNETRMVYVSGYLWGHARGFRDGCEAGEKTYSTGKSSGLPGERCIPKQPNYSRNLEDYVGGITDYYGAYPTDRYVPIFKVLDGLSDAQKLTIQQMHEQFPASSRKPQ
jgi:hypothetical protein